MCHLSQFCLTILCGIVLVFTYDVSFDGRSPSSRAGGVILDVMVQLICEAITDLVVIMMLTALDKQPVMAIAHISYKGAVFTFTVQVVQAVYLVTTFAMYPLLGRQEAGSHESTWIYFTPDNFPEETLTDFLDGNYTVC
jgi:hypothetical protein